MTQICPQCHNEVPEYAKTCKHCFQDLTSPPARKFPLGLAVGVYRQFIGYVWYRTFGVFTSHQTVQFFSRVSSTPHRFFEPRRNPNDRIPFSQIEHLEHVQVGNHTIWCCCDQNRRPHTAQGDDKSLTRQVKTWQTKQISLSSQQSRASNLHVRTSSLFQRYRPHWVFKNESLGSRSRAIPRRTHISHGETR